MEAVDRVAIGLQELFGRGAIDRDRPLLRIDYRGEAAGAPFCFSMVDGSLHRTGCRAIPKSSLPALYGVWEPGEGSQALACPRCRPAFHQAAEMKRDSSFDLLYGLLSVVDQFGSVLTERGREFRNSARGRQVSKELSALVDGLEDSQRQALTTALRSLDGIVQAVRQINKTLEQSARNGNSRRNGQPAKERPSAGNNEGV